MAKRRIPKDIKNLPSNSRTKRLSKQRDEEEIVHRTPSVTVKTRRKSRAGKIAVEVRDTTSFLFDSVLWPSLKSIIVDFFTNGIEMLLWGEERGGRSSYGVRRSRRVDYSSRSRRNKREREPRRVSRRAEVLDDIFFDNREDARLTLSRMYDTANRFGVITVGDLYQYVGVSSDRTHEMYGWEGEDLDGARIFNTADGFIIDLPEPSRIDY